MILINIVSIDMIHYENVYIIPTCNRRISNIVKLKLPMDLNFGPLVLEATTLPTEPLPILILSKIS